MTLLDMAEYSVSKGKVKIKHAEVDWDTRRLTLLRDALLQLPSHFYEENSEGGELTIVIEPYKNINASCMCVPNVLKSDGSIHLNNDVFGYDLELVTGTLVHELTHSIQPWRADDPDSRKYRDYTSPWVRKRDSILGEGKVVARRILEKILVQRPDVWRVDVSELWGKDQLTEEEKKDLFSARLLYAIGFSDGRWNKEQYDIEFFAVMAETFIQGSEHFSAMFGDYMEPEQVQDLYAFTGEKIFGGWEYSNGIAISRPQV